MRENMGIYRGKRKDTGEWVEGYLAGYDLICPGEPQDVSRATGKYYGETPYVGFIEVDPNTVGRFTGLPDKNGKRIFEGDIVRERLHGPTSVVEFCLEDVASCGCCIPSFVGSGFKAKGCNLNICEVIGNIRDNPELLEVNEND